jgi:hypothetical protein
VRCKFANKHVPTKGKILDYGTGKGYLLQYLLDEYPAIDLYACDFTDSPGCRSEKYKNKPAFKGAQLLTTLPSVYEEVL